MAGEGGTKEALDLFPRPQEGGALGRAAPPSCFQATRSGELQLMGLAPQQHGAREGLVQEGLRIWLRAFMDALSANAIISPAECALPPR